VVAAIVLPVVEPEPGVCGRTGQGYPDVSSGAESSPRIGSQ
jgi:hypothetical protein